MFMAAGSFTFWSKEPQRVGFFTAREARRKEK
jgi:hypothetical protein